MNKSYTSRLLNYREKRNINGVDKTVFFTENNTNFVVGDKVFILNGSYDSDTFVNKERRNGKYVDGYRVLEVDRCSITLDIDWIDSLLVYDTEPIDNFIKVWNIRSINELEYSKTVVVNTYDVIEDKPINRYEHKKTNNIIFIDENFEDNGVVLSQLFRDSDEVTPIVDPRKLFFAYKSSLDKWVNVSVEVQNNYPTPNFGDFLPQYSSTGLFNNKKLLILNEDIKLMNGNILKQRSVYKFNEEGNYEIDIKYKQAIISKLNFKAGIFKGEHNDGIFGTYLSPIEWDSNGTWNSGFFVNSVWKSGDMNSKSTESEESFYAYISDGLLTQVADFNNNKGFGYNYVLDSNIESGNINNGNFINCNIGTIDQDVLVSEYNSNMLLSYTTPIINGGFYNFCDIKASKFNGGTIFDSNIDEAIVINSDIVNSHINKSYLSRVNYKSENGILIQGSELWCDSLIPNGSVFVENEVYGVLKLWITETDLFRVNTLDSFYITKINKSFILSSINESFKIQLPIETKLILDNFFDSGLSVDRIQACVKLRNENRYRPIITKNNMGMLERTNVSINEPKYSIDIIIPDLGYYTDSSINSVVYKTNNTFNIDSVNNVFTNSVINTGGFNSGLMINSTWNSGYNINNENLVIDSITWLSSNTLGLSLTGNITSYKIGDIIWLDNVFFDNDILDNMFVIDNISGNTFVLLSDMSISNPTTIDIDNSIVVKSKIKGATIVGGLFKRVLITDSLFKNDKFDSSDRTLNLSNIELLRVLNTNFNEVGNKNIVKSGLFTSCNFNSVDFNGGILYDSIWDSGYANPFNGGVILKSTWLDGMFNDGYVSNTIWKNGQFNNGNFENSIWEAGTFNGGKFYNSEWYSGGINGGIFGDRGFPSSSTIVGATGTTTSVNDIVVDNATFGGFGVVNWYGGKFNGGRFVSTEPGLATWYGGDFNGGEFTEQAVWVDGTFNGGKFTSLFGATTAPGLTESEAYAWQGGDFNGGEFGSQLGFGENSVWYDGTFNGGVFQGYYWNTGIFTNGIFRGSNLVNDKDLASEYVDNYVGRTSSVYGIWNDGWVSDAKTNVIEEAETFVALKRRSELRKFKNEVEFRNMLWLSGEFNHSNASIIDSTWLDGTFKKGIFNGGVYNPFVNVTGSGKEFSNTIWENGTFQSGKMYRTTWKDGVWNNGELWGSIWENGILNYGFVYGSLWKNGKWRNGNWDGTPFTIDVDNDLEYYTMMSFVNSGMTSSATMKNKKHLTNVCRYEFGSVISGLTYPNSWINSNNIVAPDFISVSGSNSGIASTSDTYRVKVNYCDDITCYTDGELFLDLFNGYKVTVNVASGGSSMSFVKINMGELRGITQSILDITPGTSGYDEVGIPVLRLGGTVNSGTFTYFANIEDTDKSLSVYGYNLDTNVVNIDITSVDISKVTTVYDELNNNKLVDLSFNYSSFVPSVIVENGNEVFLKYGNGTFESGIWENGVWNGGYRVDDTLTLCTDITTFVQTSEFTYIIGVSLLNQADLSNFEVGDRVSISNIVGIDYNENRNLLKSSYVIQNIVNETKVIYVEIVSNVSIRNIIKDSSKHQIKMSKNVWLSGAYLNGIFNGIMNYGIISGFPLITQLSNTHMIDGIFDGGKIGNNSMVQNFNFYDNVVIKRDFTGVTSSYLPINKPIVGSQDRFYRSWADFDYNQVYGNVNLYSEDSIYDDRWSKNVQILNTSGNATNDVLSSECRLMNLNDIDFKSYELGVKYRVYNNFIPQNGLFNYPFNVSSTGGNSTEFFRYGWTFSKVSSGNIPTLKANYINTNLNNSNIMFVNFGATSSPIILNNIGERTLFTDSSNVIEKNRYSVIEFQLRSFNPGSGDTVYSPTENRLYFGNAPQLYSINNVLENHLLPNKLNTVRREFFYNRKDLDVYLLGGGYNNSFEFKSLNFNEVDMIPFFKYFSEERIDKSAKTPNNIVAPIINYNVQGVDLLGNITSTINISSQNIPAFTSFSNSVEKPINVVAKSDFNTLSIGVSWSRPSFYGNINNYEVSYKESTSLSDYFVWTSVLSDNMISDYSTVIAGLTANVLYNIRVRSVTIDPEYSQAVVVTSKITEAPLVNKYYISNSLLSGDIDGRRSAIMLDPDNVREVWVTYDNLKVYSDINGTIPFNGLVGLGIGSYRLLGDVDYNSLSTNIIKTNVYNIDGEGNMSSSTIGANIFDFSVIESYTLDRIQIFRLSSWDGVDTLDDPPSLQTTAYSNNTFYSTLYQGFITYDYITGINKGTYNNGTIEGLGVNDRVWYSIDGETFNIFPITSSLSVSTKPGQWFAIRKYIQNNVGHGQTLSHNIYFYFIKIDSNGKVVDKRSNIDTYKLTINGSPALIID